VTIATAPSSRNHDAMLLVEVMLAGSFTTRRSEPATAP
jgi:hypothetical protein